MNARPQLRVTVAILTFQRPAELAAGLPAVLKQVTELNDAQPQDYLCDVLVVDNDPRGSAADVVRSFDSPVLRYTVESRPGVSAARNRAMDSSADADLLAFIDDDERPQPGWLEFLLRTLRNTGAAAVAGRVIPEYDGELDPWIAAGRFFVRRSLPTGTTVEAAGAGNLLLDLRQIRALRLRFDEKFGLSGGEDTLFTRSLTAGGHRLVWCDEAIAVDRVPTARMSRRWVLTRAWSHGNSAGLVAVELAESGAQRTAVRARMVVRGLLRIAGGALRLLFGLAVQSDRHQARGARAVWRGSGMILGALGFVYREYDRAEGRDGRRRMARLPRDRAADHGRGRGDPARDFVVLLSFPATQPKGNPYRVLLERSLRTTPGLTVKNFSWRTALLSRYDAFHVHWPEILVSGNTSAKAFARQLLFMGLLTRLRLTRTPIVRTVHNLELPSGISQREVLLLKALDRATTLRIRINSSTELTPGQAYETIEHGHYRDWFARYPVPETIPGRVVFFGLIRRYKGVDGLIRAFRETAGKQPETSLLVVGKPSTVELGVALGELAAPDPRIDLRLEFVDDEQLVGVIGQAELVVLAYREMHNSAGVLTALSVGRPVLVPDNAVNRALAAEVGPGWVHLYAGVLTGTDILDTIRKIREGPTIQPCNLDGRDWAPSAVRHLLAYRRAASMTRRAESRSDGAPC